MRRYLLIVLLLILTSGTVSSQIGGETGFILDVPYNHAYSTPLIRSVNDTTIVSYYENDYHGVFVVMKNNSLQAYTIELSHHCYVYDFEILGNIVFFCGKRIDVLDLFNTDEHALLGWFSLSTLTGGSTNISVDYKEFDVAGMDHNKLKRMVTYKDNQNCKRILAIGESFLCDSLNQPPCHSEIDFFVNINASSNYYIDELFIFNDEVYHDIVETENYAILVGNDLSTSTSNSICFRKIMKHNIQYTERDYLYRINMPHIEPYTFIYGTQIDGIDRFITSTFGRINGVDGTVLRTFNASNDLVMMGAQFIPATSEKVQPYELTYIPGNGKVLLLQLSTNNPSTRIYTIDPYATQNYQTIREYSPNWTFYSLDKYSSDKYIVMGTTGTTPAFYARNVLYNTPHCVNQKIVDVKKIDIFKISKLYIPLNIGNSPTVNSIDINGISAERDLSVECN